MRTIYIARWRHPRGGGNGGCNAPCSVFCSIHALQANRNVRCCSCALWQWLSRRRKCWLKLRDLVTLCPFLQALLCRDAVSSLLRQIFLVWALIFTSPFMHFLCPVTIRFSVLLIIMIILFSSSSSADSLVLIINDEKRIAIQMSSHQQLPQLHYYLHTVPGDIFYNMYVM